MVLVLKRLARTHTKRKQFINQELDPWTDPKVDFETWRRLVNGIWRTSILYHGYTNNITKVISLGPVETIIGDHLIQQTDGFKQTYQTWLA